MAKKWIISFIDFFYPPFCKVMPLQTFRYAACGGTNTLLDIFIFFISFNFILDKQDLNLGVIVLKPHVAAFLMRTETEIREKAAELGLTLPD